MGSEDLATLQIHIEWKVVQAVWCFRADIRGSCIDMTPVYIVHKYRKLG